MPIMETEKTEKVDKSGWEPGPWKDEPDRVEFEAFGFPALIVRGPVGAPCGYVAVPPGHPWYDQGYDDVDVRVHGGLTYSGRCAGHICHVPKPGEPDDVYWLGFDCGHSGDLSPKFLELMKSSGIAPLTGMYAETYKDVEYVRGEVMKLARQAKDVAG